MNLTKKNYFKQQDSLTQTSAAAKKPQHSCPKENIHFFEDSSKFTLLCDNPMTVPSLLLTIFLI